MCIKPHGWFIATFPIDAFKYAPWRKSQYSPTSREFAADPDLFDMRRDDRGCMLQYGKGEWVESPSGPGIHVYLRDPFPGSDQTVFPVIIPPGAAVWWERLECNETVILAASEVLVVG